MLLIMKTKTDVKSNDRDTFIHFLPPSSLHLFLLLLLVVIVIDNSSNRNECISGSLQMVPMLGG